MQNHRIDQTVYSGLGNGFGDLFAYEIDGLCWLVDF